MHIYKLQELEISKWQKLDRMPDPWWSIGIFVEAALCIKQHSIELKNWNGRGEYWLSPLPLSGKYMVICRPDANPFGVAYLVTPVEMPGLETL